MKTRNHLESSERPCDVLIVGAGPTGLSLATALAAQGKNVTIIDRQAEGTNTSRAAVVHAHTLEVLEAVSVADRMVARGLKCHTFTVRDRDRALLSLDFRPLPTRYPYTLMISQAQTEAILLARLRELGGDVLRPATLAGVQQDANGVTATLEDGRCIRASYLVGADGMHSKVREIAAIEFAGDRYAQSFVLADVRLSGGIPLHEVILYFSPEGLVVVAPLPGGFHRIVATVDEAPESPTVQDIQALLDARGPAANPAKVEDLVWSSRFRVHHRIAAQYRSSRILLAGDAAHVHSPAGGQGMNTGIQDAMALAPALVQAIDRNDVLPLDQYAAERKPVAESVIALADRLTRVATVPRRMTPVRNFVVGMLNHVPPFRRKLAMQLAGLTHRSTASDLGQTHPAQKALESRLGR